MGRLILPPIGLLLAVLAAGCAPRVAQPLSPGAELSTAGESFTSCVDAVAARPEFARLTPHTPEDLRSATLAQLSDTSFATPEEAILVMREHDTAVPCRQLYLENLTRELPAIATIQARQFAENDTLAVALVQRRISWGTYTRQRQQVSQVTGDRIMTTLQRLEAGQPLPPGARVTDCTPTPFDSVRCVSQ